MFYTFFFVTLINSRIIERNVDVIEAIEGSKTNEFCISMDSLGNCLTCASGYVDKNNCVFPKVQIKHCLTYQSETECSQCAYGYKLDDS